MFYWVPIYLNGGLGNSLVERVAAGRGACGEVEEVEEAEGGGNWLSNFCSGSSGSRGGGMAADTGMGGSRCVSVTAETLAAAGLSAGAGGTTGVTTIDEAAVVLVDIGVMGMLKFKSLYKIFALLLYI
jgi:hypothetical protein